MKLTARHVVKTLGEHALAFWNYYNPSGRPLEELDTELSEDTINGILLSALLEESTTMDAFDERADRIDSMSQGVIPRSHARTLLARAYGYKYSRQVRGAAYLNKGKVPCLLHQGMKVVQPDLMSVSIQGMNNRARYVASVREQWTYDTLAAHIAAQPSVNLQDLDKYQRQLRVFLMDKPMRVTKSRINFLLGYDSWNALFGCVFEEGRAPNLALNPEAMTAEQQKGYRDRRTAINELKNQRRVEEVRAKKEQEAADESSP